MKKENQNQNQNLHKNTEIDLEKCKEICSKFETFIKNNKNQKNTHNNNNNKHIQQKILEIEQNIQYLLEILACYAQALQKLCEKIKLYEF